MFTFHLFSKRIVVLAACAGLTLLISQPGCKSGGTATTGPAGNASSLASKGSDPLLNSGTTADAARATANKSGSEAKGTTADSTSKNSN